SPDARAARRPSPRGPGSPPRLGPARRGVASAPGHGVADPAPAPRRHRRGECDSGSRLAARGPVIRREGGPSSSRGISESPYPGAGARLPHPAPAPDCARPAEDDRAARSTMPLATSRRRGLSRDWLILTAPFFRFLGMLDQESGGGGSASGGPVTSHLP